MENLKKSSQIHKDFHQEICVIFNLSIFYRKILQQLVAKFVEKKEDQQIDAVETDIQKSLIDSLASLPWGHYVIIMDHCKNAVEKF